MDTPADCEDPAPPPGPPSLLPLPAGADRVVLFGGSFDPPTRTHTAVADRARALGAGPDAWLVLVPAARSPLKDHAPTPDAHRLAMLRLAAAPLDRAAVWTDELDRAHSALHTASHPAAPSYWIDTLRRARALLPDARLWFILGADQAAQFHRWRAPHEILRLAQPIVVLRGPLATIDALQHTIAETGVWSDEELAEWCGSVVDLPPTPGSATEARELLASPNPAPADLAELLDDAVLAYITEHRLYRA
ncbi:MAG: nicotinate-nicotinamide nucleotide adenylyltransferase [Phycisphaerales bacterium]|nr:nicotinate-nicotinamide nucleotide adenylyltransferase [Phycisphaerales bacterium]